jgi:hypothetical protein
VRWRRVKVDSIVSVVPGLARRGAWSGTGTTDSMRLRFVGASFETTVGPALTTGWCSDVQTTGGPSLLVVNVSGVAGCLRAPCPSDGGVTRSALAP